MKFFSVNEKANYERWHNRQYELKVCRCNECKRRRLDEERERQKTTSAYEELSGIVDTEPIAFPYDLNVDVERAIEEKEEESVHLWEGLKGLKDITRLDVEKVLARLREKRERASLEKEKKSYTPESIHLWKKHVLEKTEEQNPPSLPSADESANFYRRMELHERETRHRERQVYKDFQERKERYLQEKKRRTATYNAHHKPY